MKGWRAALTPTGVWRVIVPGVCLVAGLLFATSHEVAQGHELRSPATADLADLVRNAERQVDTESATLRQLQAEAKAATDAAAADDTQVGRLKTEEGPLLVAAGREAVSGPGILVVLDDAPTVPDDPTVDPNQLVVHQSDLQAVVNALWAGGADGLAVMGQRLITTGAVRCVGNTLLLYGRTYSPPFRVTAVGDPTRLRASLATEPGVRLYRQAVDYFGLGYEVKDEREVTLPGYDGPVRLGYAEAVPQ